MEKLTISQCKSMRVPPLTEPERLTLLDLVEQRKDILFSLDGKASASQRKSDEWKKIADLMNSSCASKRDGEQYRKCFENIKYKGRDGIQRKRKSQTLTGGGPPASPLTEEQLKVLDVLGSDNPTISGEPSGIDSFHPDKIKVKDSIMHRSSRASTEEQFDDEQQHVHSSSSIKGSLNSFKSREIKRPKINEKEKLAQEVLELERQKQTELSNFMLVMTDLAQTAKEYLQYKTLKLRFEIQNLMNLNPGLEPCQIVYENSKD